MLVRLLNIASKKAVNGCFDMVLKLFREKEDTRKENGIKKRFTKPGGNRSR